MIMHFNGLYNKRIKYANLLLKIIFFVADQLFKKNYVLNVNFILLKCKLFFF